MAGEGGRGKKKSVYLKTASTSFFPEDNFSDVGVWTTGWPGAQMPPGVGGCFRQGIEKGKIRNRQHLEWQNLAQQKCAK